MDSIKFKNFVTYILSIELYPFNMLKRHVKNAVINIYLFYLLNI